MNSFLGSLEAARLRWFPQVGIGYYPVTESPYDAAYWERYRAMDRTPAGDALTAARLGLVGDYYNGDSLVDVGIGGGRFVADRPRARGFDINPEAVAWLKGTGRWCDPYAESVDAACFWDSLEHIHDPAPLLANVRYYAFVSLPIFAGPEEALRSKHFRPTEHCWYFTPEGLRWFMGRHGFRQLERSTMEQACGREGIETYVFGRFSLCNT